MFDVPRTGGIYFYKRGPSSRFSPIKRSVDGMRRRQGEGELRINVFSRGRKRRVGVVLMVGMGVRQVLLLKYTE